MELLDPRLIQVNASQPTSFCRFGGPDLVNIVSGTIRPTFAIEPTNTASLDVTGSFTQTDVPGATCAFPLGATYTPVISRVGGTEVYPCQPLTLATTYTGITCDSVTWNALPTGTWQLKYNAAGNYSTSMVPNTFVITTPTTATETAYEDVTSSTTLPPTPSNTVTATSTTSIETISSIPAAEPSSTVFETVYSTTVIVISTSTPDPLSTETVNEYTSTKVSTISLLPDLASTITVSVESCSTSPATTSSSSESNSSSATSSLKVSVSSSTSSIATTSATYSATSPAATCTNGAECATSNGATYSLTCSTLLVGDEISTSYQDDYESCAADCESIGSCIAFSWLANKKCHGGGCSLLSSVSNSVPGGPKDVSGWRTDTIALPKRKVNGDRWLVNDEPVLSPRNDLPARQVAHCTSCHPDYTYPPVPTTTTTVSVVVSTTTITPDASGESTDVVLVGATTTEVEATPTSGVTTTTVTTDTTSSTTTILDATVTTFTSSLAATTYTTITPAPLDATTVTVTYCTY